MGQAYFIVTTQRSGHHAFINSILTNNHDPCFFINNPGGKKSVYPIKYLNNKIHYRYQFNDSGKTLLANNGFKNFHKVGDNIHSLDEAPSESVFQNIFKKSAQSKLIINHEGGYLRMPKIKKYNKKMNKFVGSEKFYEINFFRDPLNLLASILTRSCLYKEVGETQVSTYDPRNKKHSERMKELINKMGKYLEYFSITSEHELTIDYMTWMSDNKFRLALQDRLNLIISEPSSRSTIHGGGSSFKKTSSQHSSYSSRFELFIGTEPFESVVKHFEQQITNYYQKIGTLHFPKSHSLLNSI